MNARSLRTDSVPFAAEWRLLDVALGRCSAPNLLLWAVLEAPRHPRGLVLRRLKKYSFCVEMKTAAETEKVLSANVEIDGHKLALTVWRRRAQEAAVLGPGMPGEGDPAGEGARSRLCGQWSSPCERRTFGIGAPRVCRRREGVGVGVLWCRAAAGLAKWTVLFVGVRR